jgi:hypothetical protein
MLGRLAVFTRRQAMTRKIILSIAVVIGLLTALHLAHNYLQGHGHAGHESTQVEEATHLH